MSLWGRGHPCCPEDAGDGASNRNTGVRTGGSESHDRVWPVFIRLGGIHVLCCIGTPSTEVTTGHCAAEKN